MVLLRRGINCTSEIPRAFRCCASLPRAPVSDRGKLDSALVA